MCSKKSTLLGKNSPLILDPNSAWSGAINFPTGVLPAKGRTPLMRCGVTRTVIDVQVRKSWRCGFSAQDDTPTASGPDGMYQRDHWVMGIRRLTSPARIGVKIPKFPFWSISDITQRVLTPTSTTRVRYVPTSSVRPMGNWGLACWMSSMTQAVWCHGFIPTFRLELGRPTGRPRMTRGFDRDYKWVLLVVLIRVNGGAKLAWKKTAAAAPIAWNQKLCWLCQCCGTTCGPKYSQALRLPSSPIYKRFYHNIGLDFDQIVTKCYFASIKHHIRTTNIPIPGH